MRKYLFGLAAALVSAGAVFAAGQVPDSVRHAVQSEIDTAMAPDPEDHAATVPPHHASAKMFHRLDINNDGIADWRVDYNDAPNGSYFCGTGGCLQQIYVSNRDGGYDLVVNTQVRAFKLKRSKGRTLLDVDFHGSVCGGFGVDACPRSYVWSPTTNRFIGRGGSKGQSFMIGGPTPLITPPQASLPGPVRAALADREARCKAAGGSYPYDAALVAEVDDLNGDGRSDWVVGGAYDGCAFDETPDHPPQFDVEVLTSRADGYGLAWRSSSTEVWGLDMAGGKATFVTLDGGEDCGLNGKDCQQIRWRWNGSALVSKAAEQP